MSSFGPGAKDATRIEFPHIRLRFGVGILIKKLPNPFIAVSSPELGASFTEAPPWDTVLQILHVISACSAFRTNFPAPACDRIDSARLSHRVRLLLQVDTTRWKFLVSRTLHMVTLISHSVLIFRPRARLSVQVDFSSFSRTRRKKGFCF